MVLNWENHTFPWKKTMTIVIRVLLLFQGYFYTIHY